MWYPAVLSAGYLKHRINRWDKLSAELTADMGNVEKKIMK